MRHIFVLNPRSLPKESDRERVVREIDGCFSRGAFFDDDYSVYVSRYPRDAVAFVRRSLAEGKGEPARVYAVGGDGILFDCLNGIVGIAGAELASIPYGNSNDAVRMFGENQTNLFRDIGAQAAARAVPADIIRCGDNYALNTCSVGLEADTVMTALKMYGGIRKKVRHHAKLNSFLYNAIFYLAGVKSVFDKKLLEQRYAVTVDGEDLSGEYGNINIANGPCYGGDKNAVVTAMPDDGILDSVFFRSTGRLKAASLIVPYARGEFRRFPEAFVWRRFRKIEIRSDEPLLIQLDGETFVDTHISVEIVPNGIKLAAPGESYFKKRTEIYV